MSTDVESHSDVDAAADETVQDFIQESVIVPEIAVKYLEQYLGLWALDEHHGRALAFRLSRIDLVTHIRNAEAQTPELEYEVIQTDGGPIAVVDINGTLTKRGSSLSDAGSLIAIRRQIRSAAVDRSIAGILLRIDSPGGSVSGTADVAEAVRDAKTVKPVYAFAEDLAASAAYWIGSQADRMFANQPTALVGSIGTLWAAVDSSAASIARGRKVIIVKTGALKGTGVAGTEITGEQVAYLQDLANNVQREFSTRVAQARGTTVSEMEAADWTSGRVWTSDQALEMGLIDGIQPIETVIEQLSQTASSRAVPTLARRSKMSDTNIGAELITSAATAEQIEAACTGATAEFVLRQVKVGATLEEALKAHAAEQQQRLANLEEERNQAAEERDQLKAADSIGVGSLGSGASDGATGSVADEWHRRIQEKMDGGMTREKAVSAVVKDDPELQQALIAERNAS